MSFWGSRPHPAEGGCRSGQLQLLQHVAARVAPDAPVGQVVDRIRDLNKLGSTALDAGQTLIAPVG